MITLSERQVRLSNRYNQLPITFHFYSPFDRVTQIEKEATKIVFC